MSKSKKQSYGKQVENSNPSALAMLLLILGCIGIIMNIVVLLYASYIKMSAMFLVGAIGISFVSPLFITSIYDMYKSIKNCQNNIDKFNYTMSIIVECVIICAAIIAFVECT